MKLAGTVFSESDELCGNEFIKNQGLDILSELILSNNNEVSILMNAFWCLSNLAAGS